MSESMSIFFKNGSYIKTIKPNEANHHLRYRLYMLNADKYLSGAWQMPKMKDNIMTNLQKMFNGDLKAMDEWIATHRKCMDCVAQTFCDKAEYMCEATLLRYMLEEAVEPPKYHPVTKPVQTLQVHMMCQCGGEFRDTGSGSGSVTECQWSCEYQHKCDKCGAVQDFDRIYPYIKYEEVENE